MFMNGCVAAVSFFHGVIQIPSTYIFIKMAPLIQAKGQWYIWSKNQPNITQLDYFNKLDSAASHTVKFLSCSSFLLN